MFFAKRNEAIDTDPEIVERMELGEKDTET